MNNIERVPEELSGVKDGVKLDCKCSFVEFLEDKMKQQVCDGRILASWENGVVSVTFTANDQKMMVGVRIDELLMVMQEAHAARIDAQKGDAGEQPMQ